MSEKILVPPIKIQGIKTKLVPWIAETTRSVKYKKWIEPFLGSGVVGFNLAGKNAIFGDTNPHLIQFYKLIQEEKITPSIVRNFLEDEGVKLAKGGVEYYKEVRNRFNLHHDSFDFLFLNRSCFNGIMRFNGKGGFNVPFGHKPERFAKSYMTKICNQIKWVSEKMKGANWEFIVGDFTKIISLATKEDLIYCDPPYIARHSDYFNNWTEGDEIKLHNILNQSGSKYIVSSWYKNKYRENEYISKVWNDCRMENMEHFYHVGAKESNRNSMQEALLLSLDFTPTIPLLDQPNLSEIVNLFQ